MPQVIIYKQDSGAIAVIHPAPEALAVFGLAAIAAKDVPAGKPYKIMEQADVPADRAARAAWVVDDAELTDGVGDEASEFPVIEDPQEPEEPA